MVRRSLLRSMASSPVSSPILEEDNGSPTNSSASQESSPPPSSSIVEEEAPPITNSSVAEESPPSPTVESPPPPNVPPPESLPPPPPPPPTPPPNAPPPSTHAPSPPPPSSPPPPIASTPPPKESPKSSPPPPETPGPPPTTSQPPPPSASPPPPTPSAVSSPPSPIISSPTPPPPPGAPVPSLTLPPATLSPPPTPPPPTSSPNGTSGSTIGPGLGGPGTNPPSSSDSSIHYLIAGIVVGGVLVLVFVVACLICAKRSKKKKPVHNINTGIVPPTGGAPYYPTQWTGPQTAEQMIVLPPPSGLVGPPPGANQYSGDFYYSSGQSGHSVPPLFPTNMGAIGAKCQFTYEELAVATDGFSQANVLGQGGFGYVHRGVLQPDKRQVAVKSLKAGSGQGEREFQAEVEIISRVHHRHLVSLVGYCIAGEKKMLVYEYVPNKTLEFHLHGKGRPVMDWATRLRIAVGSAKGLAYLHEDCHPRIIHRDIKAANILLDDNFEAMVADFGLAKLTSDNYTHVSTRVMGTFGYLAPEYASSGKLTEKSDVFSFGVMLLELITGRRPVDLSNKTAEDSLVDLARPLLSKAMEDGNYNELVDARLEGNYVPQEMACMVTCSAASIRHSARRRPKMSQIVRALDGDSSLHDMNEGVKPGQSMVYHNNPNGNTEAYDTRAFDADMLRFKKMVMMSSSQEFDSSEYGATTSEDYGLNHPSSSSGDSGEVVAGKRIIIKHHK